MMTEPDQHRNRKAGRSEGAGGWADVTLPVHRRAIWYYFGALASVLLLVMVASGLLLAMYYEPGAGGATSPDGTPLVAARVLKDVRWGERFYEKGAVIALPLNPGTGQAIARGPLAGAVETILDETTRTPLRPSAAWVSLEGRIMREAEYGALIRSVHVYTSHLLIATVFIHLASTFLVRAYRKRRRWMWVSGLVLFIVILGFAFTGSALPWHRLAYSATQVAVGQAEDSLPLVGPALAAMLGGPDVGGTTLTRMFALHTMVLPLAVLLLFGAHMTILRRTGFCGQPHVPHTGGAVTGGIVAGLGVVLIVTALVLTGTLDGTSPLTAIGLSLLVVAVGYALSGAARWLKPPSQLPPETVPGAPLQQEPPRSIPAVPNALYRAAIPALLALGVIASFAVIAPFARTGTEALPADITKPIATPEGVHPEWYFMFAFELLRLLPGGLPALLFLLAGAFLFALPWLDRRRGKEGRAPALTIAGVLLLAALVALTIAGYMGLEGG